MDDNSMDATAGNASTNVSFRVHKEDLSDAVAWVARSLPTKNTQPVLRAVVITADEGLRGGKTVPLKANVDAALEKVSVEAVLVVAVVLFAFLLNLRTTAISLLAIPVSVLTTAVVFHLFGLSINTMTLGGLAIAIGGLVEIGLGIFDFGEGITA